MSTATALAVLVVGFASGVLSGIVGVGGAVLTTPGIRFLGATPIEAVGSTLPPILPGALSGTYRFARSRLIDVRLALIAGCTGAPLAAAGAVVSDHVNAHGLMVFTAMLLGWSAWRTSRPPSVPAAAAPAAIDGSDPAPDGPPVAAASIGAVGVAAGFLAGLLGVGGGVLMVPAFTGILNVPVKRAVASSLAAVAIFSIPATITHAALGHIDWAYSLFLTIGAVPGAQVGAHITIGSSERHMRTLIGVFLGGLAVVYGIRELLAL